MAGHDQMGFIYGLVARGTVVLAEHTEFSGNFKALAAECLQKLPATNNKFTYTTDGYTFNYLVNNGYVYCVVAAESVGRQIAFACLERIKDDFLKKYGGGKSAASPSNGREEFGKKIKKQMKYCTEHPEEVSKISKIQQQIDEVKNIMMENIDKIINRGVRLDVLVGKTKILLDQANEFRVQTTQVNWQMWLQNTKIMLIVLGIIIALILIIVLSICYGFKCGS